MTQDKIIKYLIQKLTPEYIENILEKSRSGTLISELIPFAEELSAHDNTPYEGTIHRTNTDYVIVGE